MRRVGFVDGDGFVDAIGSPFAGSAESAAMSAFIAAIESSACKRSVDNCAFASLAVRASLKSSEMVISLSPRPSDEVRSRRESTFFM